MSYYFVLQKLLLLCLLPRALPFHYFCATKRTVAVGPPGLFCNVSFAAPAGIYPQLYSCPSLNCATGSVRALVLCATHEKYILTLPKPLYAFMLSYSVCPPSLAVRLRPSAVYPSRIEESFTAFVKAARERARPPAGKRKRGRPLSLLSQSVCNTSG